MNQEKIDEAVLALLFLGIHERYPEGTACTWKGFDWDTMDRLHEQGLISNPVGKAKSVVFSEEGLRQSEAAFQRLFETDA